MVNMKNKAVVAIIRNNDSRILIGNVKLEKQENFGGIEYVFPGGKVEDGETLEAAVIREVKEETGLDAENPRLIAERNHPVTKKDMYYFLCDYRGGSLSVHDPKNDDLEILMWVHIDDLKKYMPSVYPAVLEYFDIKL
jgi:mutator protein MutT